MDIGSAVGGEVGVTEEQVIELARYQTGAAAFGDAERAVLDLAVASTQTPAEVLEELRNRLRKYFDETQLVELPERAAH